MSLTINEVKKKYESAFLMLDGVISMGIGIGKNKTPAIIIGVLRDREDLSCHIPTDLDGFPVEIQVIESISIH